MREENGNSEQGAMPWNVLKKSPKFCPRTQKNLKEIDQEKQQSTSSAIPIREEKGI